MFFQLLYIHLFRPFLKYNPNTSPLPAHVSPRKLCTQAAQMISKLLRLYKRSHGLRQICNIAVYIAHSACTIHLLNLPEKNAKRDIIHGVKHLEEIAEGWLCARRTLGILSVLARKWNVELPEEAATVLARTDAKFGPYTEAGTPKSAPAAAVMSPETQQFQHYATASNATSPALPTYTMQMQSPSLTSVFDTTGNAHTMSFSQTGTDMRRISETFSLPPSDATSIAYPRIQQSDLTSTPQSTSQTRHHGSIDTTSAATPNSQGNSPSQFFNGVDQLVREGQDWWLRDQSQLASGFDNWNFSDADLAWLNGSAASPVGGTNAGAMGNGNGAGGSGGEFGRNGVGGGGAVGGLNGYGSALNAYDENEWYQ